MENEPNEEIQKLAGEAMITESVKKAVRPFYKADKYESYMQKYEAYVAKLEQAGYNDTERRKYKLFHAMIGSSPTEASSPNFDFPGELSVEHFINSLKE